MTQSEQLLKNAEDILTQLRSTLDGAKNQPPPEPQAAAAFDRFVRVLGFLEARVKAMDAALASVNQLRQLSTQLTGLLGASGNFLQNAAQWQQFNNAIDQVLVATTVIPAVTAGSAADQYSAALSDFLRRSDQAAKHSEDRAAKMEERVKALGVSAAAVDARAKEIQGQVNQEKARLDKIILDSQGLIAKLVADEQARYSEAEKQRTKTGADGDTKRDAEAKAKLAELTTKFDQTVATNQKDFSTMIQAHRTSSEKAVAELSTQLAEAKKIVGLIANTGMAGHYQKVANVDWWSMWILRAIAAGFFVGAICAIYALIAAVHSLQIDWEMVVFRFALVAVVLVPAFYFARESARHMQREARNRRIELELSALQPFIARLTDPQAQEIIIKKADQYFGQEPLPDQGENNLLVDVSLRGGQVLKILDKILAAWRGK